VSYILSTEPVTLRRRTTATTYGADGRADTPTTVDSTIQASVQPLGEQALQNLSLGERQRSPRRIYTTTALQTADPDTDLAPDEIIIDGETYQLQSITRHRTILPHYRGLLLRVQEA
jgi:hypothetical protein